MGQYSDTAIRLALDVQKKYNVPASVTLAAYALESGRGTSKLAQNHNNYFGITGSGTAGSTTSGGRKWAVYNSMSESFDAFGQLMSNKRYSSLTKNADSLESYVRAYGDTYAPPSDNGGKSYAEQILQIIEGDNLAKYDTVSFSGNLTQLTTGNNETEDQGPAWYDVKGNAEEIAKRVIVAVVCIGLVVASLIFVMRAFDLKMPGSSLKDVLNDE